MRYESFRLIIIISKSHTETASNTEETTKYLKPVTKQKETFIIEMLKWEH